MTNDGQRSPSQFDGVWHGSRITADERHVSRFNGDISSGPDREADIGGGQRGRIVDSVADHADSAAGRLQRADDVGLLAGQSFGFDQRDAEFVRDVFYNGQPIAADEAGVDVQMSQRGVASDAVDRTRSSAARTPRT